ncbi:MAG: Ig-like domain-containing protein [Chloroflexi bacterium]|nr:Ig-like domain-containing protein [Chloroflexota bacterium]
MLNSFKMLLAHRQLRRTVIFTAALIAIIAIWFGPSVARAADPSPNRPTDIIAALSAGNDSTCEVKSSGTASCWGNNDDGQSTAPVGTFTQVSTGEFHTCAIKSDNKVVCWGDDSEGQSTPPNDNFKQVTTGSLHSCGIKSDDKISCWGNDDDDQLDKPSGTFTQISAGDYHTCAIKSNGDISCWGNNDDEQLNKPSGSFKQISAGGSHTCAIKTDNTVNCWGTNDDDESSPPAGAFIQVSAGSAHTCGIRSNNTVVCWGDNGEEQASPPAGSFIQISAGDLHTCGIRSDGTVSCWGNNADGQAPQLALSPVVLPVAKVGLAYTQLISTTAENYTPTLPSLLLTSGGLPNGLNLIAAPGALSGTPTLGGIYGFTLRAIDANGLSGEQVYTLKVNALPVANNQSVNIGHNTPTVIQLSASDADGDALTYSIVRNPTHGTLSNSGTDQPAYTPDSDYTGADSFTFKVNDGEDDSDVATISITVAPSQPPNTPPIANDQNVSTSRNTAKSITLSASDVDSNPLSYILLSNPTHGALGGVAPNLIYTPTQDYTGADSFAFKVNDGQADSNVATINLAISPLNTSPVANSQDTLTIKNRLLVLTLTASDAENDALTYIVNQPLSGTLTATGPNVIYTPKPDFIGNDSFTFIVNDGQANSNVATVRILVKPNVPTANKAPVADDQNVTVARNTSLNITLTASDAEDDPLSYILGGAPAHGDLSGAAPNLRYTPKPGFAGTDSFTFQVYDGNNFSGLATITIQVISTAVAPVAHQQNVTLQKNMARNIVLTASDDNGDLLTYSVLTTPLHGTLSGTAPKLVYRPNPDYTGGDSFTFKANDGQADSNTATILINVTDDLIGNTPPIANNQNAITVQETPKSITLTASDADENPLTYSIVSNPAHGVLSGTAPDLTYTPEAGFAGIDNFTFKVNDGQLDSNTATVMINVATSDARGSITGIIYNDKNANGQKDSDEPGLPHAIVILTDVATNSQAATVAGNNAERRTTTDSDGVYHFGGVRAGNYQITVLFPAGVEGTSQAPIAITVGAMGEVTPPPFALTISYRIRMPIIRR